MRYATLLPPLLLALTVAGCASQQPSYYVTDAATGQRVSTGQQAAPYDRRGLLAAGKAQASGYNSYASDAPQRQDGSDRGLFNSDDFQSNWFSRRSSAPTYVAQPQVSQTRAPQTYAYQPPPQQQAYAQPLQQQAYVQQPTTMQYRPPQPAPQPYTPPQYYRQPQPQQTGYYTASNGLY